MSTLALEITQKELKKLIFLEKSGYSEDDLLAWNPVTSKFSMRNGGLYQMSEDGEIDHLGGPSPDPADRI